MYIYIAYIFVFFYIFTRGGIYLVVLLIPDPNRHFGSVGFYFFLLQSLALRRDLLGPMPGGVRGRRLTPPSMAARVCLHFGLP
jgi:hypothetical protein